MKFEKKTFGELKPGDKILGPKGEIITLKEAYDEHIPDSMYEVETEDGNTTKVSGNHLWYIETEIDHQLHRRRLKDNYRTLKKVSNQILQDFEKILEREDDLETSLADMVSFCEFDDNEPGKQLLTRIAESLGPVSENKYSYEDMFSSNEISPGEVVFFYDMKQFVQQLLSLAKYKNYRKLYPPKKGRVVTTEMMFDLNETMSINIPDAPKTV